MNNSVSVVRGPLIYTLKLNEAWKVREHKPSGFDTLEIETDSPWNYGLVLGGNPDAAFKFEDLGPSPNPFNPATPAVQLTAKAKRLQNWRMAWNERVAFDPPISPVTSDSKAEDITLVPAGMQMLRVTSFPWIGQPKSPPRSIKPDFAKEGLIELDPVWRRMVREGWSDHCLVEWRIERNSRRQGRGDGRRLFRPHLRG